MTPQEIFEYKQRWMTGYAVRIHSDLRDRAKTWCKQLGKHQWNHKTFTNVYEDTFYFEDVYAGQNFEHEFNRWIQRN